MAYIYKTILRYCPRKIRVAFSALRDYSEKENRNGLRIELPDYEDRLARIDQIMDAVHNNDLHNYTRISEILENSDATEEQLTEVIQRMHNLEDLPQIQESKLILGSIMHDIATNLALLWDDDRYIREIEE